jgi:hypothetical protein
MLLTRLNRLLAVKRLVHVACQVLRGASSGSVERVRDARVVLREASTGVQYREGAIRVVMFIRSCNICNHKQLSGLKSAGSVERERHIYKWR